MSREGFALLAGQLQHKLEREFPELSESLLQILYPHLLAPVPAMSIAQSFQAGSFIGPPRS